MKRTIFLSTAAMASLALAACNSKADETPAPAPAETTAAAPAPAPAPAAAADPEVEPNGTVIEVQMLTRDPDGGGMQAFKPKIIRAKVGDTIKFMPTDPTHQSSSIEGMLPEGARGWKGEINKEVSYVVPKPGVYGFECIPHYAAGMVGLVIVEGEGMEANVAAAKAVTHPGLAGKKFTELFTEAGL